MWCAGCSGVWSAAADQVRFFPDILPLNGNFLDPVWPSEAQNLAPRPDLNVVKLPPKLCGKKGSDSGKGSKLAYAPRSGRDVPLLPPPLGVVMGKCPFVSLDFSRWRVSGRVS